MFMCVCEPVHLRTYDCTHLARVGWFLKMPFLDLASTLLSILLLNPNRFMSSHVHTRYRSWYITFNLATLNHQLTMSRHLSLSTFTYEMSKPPQCMTPYHSSSTNTTKKIQNVLASSPVFQGHTTHPRNHYNLFCPPVYEWLSTFTGVFCKCSLYTQVVYRVLVYVMSMFLTCVHIFLA